MSLSIAGEWGAMRPSTAAPAVGSRGTGAAEDEFASVGASLAEFKTLGELGKGAYGVVYRVLSLRDGKEYVLKKILIQHLKKHEIQDVVKEAKILRRVDNQHIVKSFSHFVEDGALHIVMEYAEGGDLQKYLKNMKKAHTTVPETEVWRFAQELAIALVYLHAHKIIHRDVKTLNVFLTKDLKVKIVKNAVAAQNTRVGTPLYLAPELIKQKPYDYKIDVWALGCILYQLCTGKSPFSGENLISLGYNIVHTQQASIPSSYSKELQELINLLMEKNPSKRLSSEEALAFIGSHSKAKPTAAATPVKTTVGQAIGPKGSGLSRIGSEPQQPAELGGSKTTGLAIGRNSGNGGGRSAVEGAVTNGADGLPGTSAVKPTTTQPDAASITPRKTHAVTQSSGAHGDAPGMQDSVGIDKKDPPQPTGMGSPGLGTNTRSIRKPIMNRPPELAGSEQIEKSFRENPYHPNSKLGSQDSLVHLPRTSGSPGNLLRGPQAEQRPTVSKREEGSGSTLKVGNFLLHQRREIPPSHPTESGEQVHGAHTIPTAQVPSQRPATAGVLRGRPGSRYSNKDHGVGNGPSDDDHQMLKAKNRFAPISNKPGDKMKAMEIMLKRATVDDPICAILKQNSAARPLEGRNISPVGHRKPAANADHNQGQMIRIGSPSGVGRGRSNLAQQSELGSYRNQASSSLNGPSSTTKPSGLLLQKHEVDIDEAPYNPFPSTTMASLGPVPSVVKPAASHPFLDPYRAIFSGVLNQDQLEENQLKDSEDKKKSDMFAKRQRPQTASANLQSGSAQSQGRYNSTAMMKVHPGGYLARGSLNMGSGPGNTAQTGTANTNNQSVNYRIKSSTPQSNSTNIGSRPATAGGTTFLPPFQSTDSATQPVRFKKFTVNDI